MELLVYGDFNCPFSALASMRAGRLERLAHAKIDWRAVEHEPDLPLTGREVTGSFGAEFRSTLDEVRGLLTADEDDEFTVPTFHANTRLATAAYAATAPLRRQALRGRLFHAYWSEGQDLADLTTLTSLDASGADHATVARWRNEWLALGEPIVPALVLPDGHISKGQDALALLANLLGAIRPA